MTEEEKNEMENHVRSLQEGYKLLSNEDLKKLQEEQSLDDENMDDKVSHSVILLPIVYSLLSLIYCMIVKLHIGTKMH